MTQHKVHETESQSQPETQRLLARLLYEQHAQDQAFDHTRRSAERFDLSVVVVVTPMVDGVPQVDLSFFTVTKNISVGGVAFVVNSPLEFDEVLLGIRLPSETQVSQLRGKIRHQTELGGGFRQVGVEVREVFNTADFPLLERFSQ